ncbi:cytochrome p450 [Colletotrichum truncatum]|uniref:Cytochrome p450 n=1 Tax=Colletotrichum truncatum TaxID=5467 RepID=A0ACC3ZAZ4_COLTU|nr:cytochrome p450 [Colletotrichum truncatum]KAF6783188.1 cytochrome p450 [Colletotrichum truncatum]
MNSTLANVTGVRPDPHTQQGLVTTIGSQSTLLVIFGLLASYLFYAKNAKSSKYANLPLPPGPPRLPLIGNMFNNPDRLRWIVHYLWKLDYGPVVYLNVFGNPIIVLTTVEAAHDLINKRASKYAGRPLSVIGGELLAKGYNMAFRQYDSRTRLHQRLHVPGLNPRSANVYQPIHKLESLELLHDMIQDSKFDSKPNEKTIGSLQESVEQETKPQDPRLHFQRAAGSSMNAIMFGRRLVKGDPDSDAKMDFFNTCPTLNIIEKITLVDIFPFLKHIPHVISPWKRVAEPLFEIEKEFHLKNLHNALEQPGYNLSKQILDSAKRLDPDMSETEVAWVLGALFIANSDTSPSFLCWLVVMMINHPQVIRKAQSILDEVVGHDRLPMYEDRAQMVYIDAIIDEVFRWRPILPTGLEHSSTEEDEYNGYRIPKNSIMIISQWAMARDKAAFGADADEFRPERWMERDDLPTVVFGHGRRTCPGRHVARDALWIMVARLLWAFDMEAPFVPNTTRRKIIDEMAMPTHGIIIGPSPFEAVFRPRGEWVERVVQKDFEEADFDLGKIMEQVAVSKGFQ